MNGIADEENRTVLLLSVKARSLTLPVVLIETAEYKLDGGHSFREHFRTLCRRPLHACTEEQTIQK